VRYLAILRKIYGYIEMADERFISIFYNTFGIVEMCSISEDESGIIVATSTTKYFLGKENLNENLKILG